MNCKLCPRACDVDREKQVGYCGMGNLPVVARAALHMWEEPVISGTSGSGTVFFSGCSLGCVFCQNHNIALGKAGKEISLERLVEIFFELEEKGANNINLVTPGHFIYGISQALIRAKKQGLKLPVVYNTGSYENVEALKQMDGLVDVYLPDFKYFSPEIARRYANAPDYFEIAARAISEMYRQVGKPVFCEEGNQEKIMEYTGEEEHIVMKKGMIIRHLLLPEQVEDSKHIIRYLHETYGDKIYLSIMNQYTPRSGLEKFPELQRKITVEEYDAVVDYALDIGVTSGFIQEGDTAKESFIPEFNLEGV